MAALPRICFVGNCQAQALSSLAGHLAVEAEVVRLPAVFDIKAFDNPSIYGLIDECDFIFNQRVSDSFQLELIRPSNIRERLGSRSFSWPNIYFDGYFPGIQYQYALDGSKLTGPLSDYHFSTVRDAWKNGQDAGVCTKALLSEHPPTVSPTPVEQSLYELRMREVGLDVNISDYIANVFRIRKVFYSMNHPSNEVLLEMLRRLLGKTDIKIRRPEDVITYPYTLNKIDLPTLAIFDRNYRPHFSVEKDIIKGVSVVFSADYAGEGQDEKAYSFEDLIECYYRLYDWHQKRRHPGSD